MHTSIKNLIAAITTKNTALALENIASIVKDPTTAHLLNQSDAKGMTPLHYACLSYEKGATNAMRIIRELVRHDADFALRNNEGKTPDQLLVSLSNEETKLLIANLTRSALDEPDPLPINETTRLIREQDADKSDQKIAADNKTHANYLSLSNDRADLYLLFMQADSLLKYAPMSPFTAAFTIFVGMVLFGVPSGILTNRLLSASSSNSAPVPLNSTDDNYVSPAILIALYVLGTLIVGGLAAASISMVNTSIPVKAANNAEELSRWQQLMYWLKQCMSSQPGRSADNNVESFIQHVDALIGVVSFDDDTVATLTTECQRVVVDINKLRADTDKLRQSCQSNAVKNLPAELEKVQGDIKKLQTDLNLAGHPLSFFVKQAPANLAANNLQQLEAGDENKPAPIQTITIN